MPDFQSIAARHGFSVDAIQAAWNALRNGGGTMAQFSHWELGGGGQWLPGMLMIGDMFNNNLKSRVDNLFYDLQRQPLDPPPPPPQQPWPSQSTQSQYQNSGNSGSGNFGSGNFASGPSISYGGGQVNQNWYPAHLGNPSSTGSQNNVRYAYFPSTCRLAIDLFGRVTIYDTGSHFISGVSQGQSNDAGSITFTSQFGTIPISALPIVG